MLKRLLFVVPATLIAFFVLSVSLLHATDLSPVYCGQVNTANTQTNAEDKLQIEIDYSFPYPGKILPDNTLWSIKALRDRLWRMVTVDSSRQTELVLLFADKRLMMAKTLFEKGNPEVALSTLSKGEKYLAEAAGLLVANGKKGMDVCNIGLRVATASLKHREVIENLLPVAPDAIRPEMVKASDYAKEAYKSSRDALRAKNCSCPENPFLSD